MKNIAVITKTQSDLYNVLNSIKQIKVQMIKPDEVIHYDLSVYHSVCILGGTDNVPLMLTPSNRIKIEEQLQSGKKIFAEFVNSMENQYGAGQSSTRFKRLVYTGDNQSMTGTILEDQSNEHIIPCYVSGGAKPIMIYKGFMDAHAQVKLEKEDTEQFGNFAIWLDQPNFMLCNFRLSNFGKARFAPSGAWKAVVQELIEWITDEQVEDFEYPRAYWTNTTLEKISISESVDLGIRWFDEAEMLVQNGKGGVLEGITTAIFADGTQERATGVRSDCTGDVALTFFADYLRTGDKTSLEKSDNLEAFCFEIMQEKNGLLKGMMRWTTSAWGVCYQDDTSRVLIGSMFKMLYGGDKKYLQNCCDALDFLLATTGSDGLRISRTDNIFLTEEEMKRLRETPSDFPCGHHNAYYMAALLMCGKLTGNQKYIKAAIKGMNTLMKVYPDTIREHSETQELCRLILPLAWLYYCTKSDKHLKWLYMVTTDLQKMKHKSGAYLEWDTGYKAHRSKQENAECSLLTNNGDPVVDMLYSINWLPMNFVQAYLITGDEYFIKLWKEIAEFFVKSQIHSSNSLLNGAWTRGFDVDMMEVYGNPYDTGWGPWSIETGWTVSNIITGLIFGEMTDKLKPYYDESKAVQSE